MKIKYFFRKGKAFPYASSKESATLSPKGTVQA